MSFDARTNSVTDFAAEITPRVIFGAHACDINAVNRLDLVFKDGRYPDPYYVARRNATLIVGISCMPSRRASAICGAPTRRVSATTCFCRISAESTWSAYPASRRRTSSRRRATRAWPPTRTVSSSATPRVGARRRSTTLFPTSRTWPCSWTRSTRTRSGRSWADAACRARRARRCAPRASASTSRTRSIPPARRVGASACGTRALRRSSRRWPAATTSATTGATACGTACTTSSTDSSRTTTACCAWAAGAA